jgi:iron complex transport system substrate-binding protein
MRNLLRSFVLVLAAIGLQAQAAPPQRIVSLLPSLTETVCALGHCDALVAVDDFSDWPPQVQRLPHVGGLEDANIERIVALKPDLVLLAASTRAKARLESLHIPVLAFEPKTIAEVDQALAQVAAVFGEPQLARRLWARMNEGIDMAARSLPPSRKGTRVYFEVDSGPYAAGPESHIGELFTRLGVVNIIPANLGSVPKVNPEFVVRADPQVIIIAARDAPDLRSRPGWDRISAVRSGHVCALDAQQLDAVARPGPRLAEAARVLAECIAR